MLVHGFVSMVGQFHTSTLLRRQNSDFHLAIFEAADGPLLLDADRTTMVERFSVPSIWLSRQRPTPRTHSASTMRSRPR
jgi:DNA-binding GntR family transcriptional regulator